MPSYSITITATADQAAKIVAAAENAYGRQDGETDLQLVKRAAREHFRALYRAGVQLTAAPAQIDDSGITAG